MGRLLRPFLMFSLCFFTFSGCQSAEEKVAEFCVNWDQAVKNSENCDEMNKKVIDVLEMYENTRIFSQDSIPKASVAWLPCKAASSLMLRRCGDAEVFRPSLERFYFSTVFQNHASEN